MRGDGMRRDRDRNREPNASPDREIALRNEDPHPAFGHPLPLPRERALTRFEHPARRPDEGRWHVSQSRYALTRVYLFQFLTLSATFCGVRPRCSAICSAGADAPKRSMPITSAS